jgi:hypothetical protein
MRPYGTLILLASFPAKKSIILYKLIIAPNLSLVIYKWSVGKFALQTFAIATFGKMFHKNVLSEMIYFVNSVN